MTGALSAICCSVLPLIGLWNLSQQGKKQILVLRLGHEVPQFMVTVEGLRGITGTLRMPLQGKAQVTLPC